MARSSIILPGSSSDLPAIVIGLVSALLLIRFKVNSTWLVLGGATIGVLNMLLR